MIVVVTWVKGEGGAVLELRKTRQVKGRESCLERKICLHLQRRGGGSCLVYLLGFSKT